MKLNKILSWLVVGGLLFLSVTPLIVSTSLFFPFISGKGFFFRVVMEIVLVLWIILALRDPNYRPRLHQGFGGQARRSWLLIAMGILLVVLALATAWGANPYRSFWSNFERMEGLVSYLHLFAYFLVLISVFRQEKTWKIFAHVLLGVNAVIAVFSILQLTGYSSVNQGGVRIDATFGNATYLAVYELIHIFLILFCLVRFWQAGGWGKGIWWRGLALGYVLLGLLDLVFLYKTATRGAILGSGLGLIISALLIIWRAREGGEKVFRRMAWITLGVAVLVIGGFFAVKNSPWVAQSETLSRFASISATDRTTESRFMVWNMSWQGFKERPILGWGPENYILVFNKYYDPAMYNQEPWFDRSHNVVFDWLISAGALGLLSYLSLFVLSIYLLWWKKNNLSITERSLITGLLVAYFIHNIFVFDNLVSYLLFFAVLGYIHFKSTEDNPVTPTTSLPKNSWPLAPVVIIVVILFVPTFFWITFKPWLANRTMIQALSSQKYPKEELVLFKKVFVSQTFASTEASEQLINVALGAGQNQSIRIADREVIASLAREQMLETIKREPENARYPFFLGSFLSRFGLYDEAKTYLTKALELTPRKQTVLFELGGLSINQKTYDEALNYFRQAYELDKSYPEAQKLYALGAIYDNKLSLAASLLDDRAKSDPAFLLDERLVQAYGSINQPNALVTLWQKAIVSNPKFEKTVMDFIADLKKRGIVN